jgi:hypothetical protein
MLTTATYGWRPPPWRIGDEYLTPHPPSLRRKGEYAPLSHSVGRG